MDRDKLFELAVQMSIPQLTAMEPRNRERVYVDTIVTHYRRLQDAYAKVEATDAATATA